MSTGVNPNLELAEEVFRSLLWDPAVKSALSALYVQAPWLNFWPVRSITDGLAALISENFYQIFKTFIDVGTIKIINEEHKAAYDLASLKLKIIGIEKGIASHEFAKAREEAKAALSRFTRINLP